MRQAKIHVTLREADGRTYALHAEDGQSLMRAAVAAGVAGIVADCGGLCTCATCHVIVDDAWFGKLPPAGGDERAMLEMTAVPSEATSRLACQITLRPELDGLAATLPASQF